MNTNENNNDRFGDDFILHPHIFNLPRRIRCETHTKKHEATGSKPEKMKLTKYNGSMYPKLENRFYAQFFGHQFSQYYRHTIFFLFIQQRCTEFIAKEKWMKNFSLRKTQIFAVKLKKMVLRWRSVRMWLRRLFVVKWSDSSHWIHVFIEKTKTKKSRTLFSLLVLCVWSRVGVYCIVWMKTANVFCCFSTHIALLSCWNELTRCAVIKIGGLASRTLAHGTQTYWLFDFRHCGVRCDCIGVGNECKPIYLFVSSTPPNISDSMFTFFGMERGVHGKCEVLPAILCTDKNTYVFWYFIGICRRRRGALLVANARMKKFK